MSNGAAPQWFCRGWPCAGSRRSFASPAAVSGFTETARGPRAGQAPPLQLNGGLAAQEGDARRAVAPLVQRGEAGRRLEPLLRRHLDDAERALDEPAGIGEGGEGRRRQPLAVRRVEEGEGDRRRG